MEPPAMKLIMVRGPRSGETIEFKPGSKIRIGRIMRGNDVTIKDEGISSKHLIIESVSGKWTIRDLDSCNGTFLNSTTLPPNTPFDLRENDNIKLGDCTTISVQMITMDSQDESVAKPKRNPRRQANVPGTSSVRATRGRTKAEAEPVETLGLEGVTLTAGVRVTRSRMNALNLGCDRGEMAATESKITRKGRGRKKKLQEMPPQSSEVETEGKERLVPEELSKTCEVQADGNENLKSEEVAKEGDAKETCDKVEDTVDNGVQEQKVDLAKMTLGEWFDYVEVYLRKQILNTTEEMIKEMKNKAERVHKYMIEEKKKKMDKL